MAANPERRPMADPLDFAPDEFPGQGGVRQGMHPAVLPSGQDELTVNIFGGFVTAQKVAIKRNMGDVLRRMYELAGVMGMEYVYRIPYRSKQKDARGKDVQGPDGKPVWETVYVEGPTIVLANDLAREWGNCNVETRSFDRGTYWEFHSRFVDLETGYTLSRPFQQRKGQDTGMKDAERRMDQVYQIGVSKAQRNVVVNVLQGLTQKIVAQAKRGVRAKIDAKPEEAKAWIMEQISELKIDIKLIERAYGRAHAHWTAADLAGIFMEIKSVQEGLADQKDIWGEPESSEPAQPKAAAGGDGPGGGIPPNSVKLILVDKEGVVIGEGLGPEPQVGDPVKFSGSTYHVDGIQGDFTADGKLTIVVHKVETIPGGEPKAEEKKADAKAPAKAKKLFGDKKDA